MVEMIKCTKCGELKPDTEFYGHYNGKRKRSQCKKCHYEYGKNWRKNHKDRSNGLQRDYQRNNKNYRENQRKLMFDSNRKFKQELVDIAGGKCQDCGYNKCIGALDFHHVNPDEKETLRINCKESREKMKKLLREGKARMTCANCHREKHWNEKSSGRKRNE
jgi:adenine-specific DNA methylase